ncbi:AAA domain-containing protein [Hydrogenophaga sp.]|uniref:AAA domain-containing protein n=1 Tax=Hydrogenophaga sp. TaxID=1904254 RepID=UPI00286E9F68|nr:AAA domain-containing protein [Hydrogenophaga sp.]
MDNSSASETIIAGWRVLREVSSTAGRLDKYLVQEEAGERQATLTLYHHGWEPDPSVYDALRRVSLEYIPQILATGRWQDRAFEVIEELTGGTLAELGIVATDEESARRIAYELGKALEALAEVGLRHRDIRPGTLLVRNRNPLDLVIGAFESARLSEYDLDIVSPLEVTRYTSPEAVAGGVAAASDWWSLGIVLLEQVTGGKCFEAIDQQAFLIHVLANGVPIPPEVPSNVALLLRGLLTRDRHKRWKWKEVQAWLNGQSPETTEPEQVGGEGGGPAIPLGGKKYSTLTSYALAAASAEHWEEARDQLLRGVVTDWVQQKTAPNSKVAALRRIVKDESVTDDWRLVVALKVLNPDMPPVMKGAIVSPKWLLENPYEGYELICGPVPDLLHELDQDGWLLRLKVRVAAVRERAEHLNIDLDEDTLRVYLLSTSKARLSAEWNTRRSIFPDSEHLGLLNLLERRSLAEEDLIVVLSAAPTLFHSRDALVEEARRLALAGGVPTFDVAAAGDMVTWPRGEILELVTERIEGFAECAYPVVNDWADKFRLDRRLPLSHALVLLSVPAEQWQEPRKQQYVSQLLSFFEKKVVAAVMRGPLVRMTIGKSTPRVDIRELHTKRMDAAGLLDHLLKRNVTPLTLDPTALDPSTTTALRLQALDRSSALYKRDTGIDGLYLGFPFLLTRENKPGARARIAPVLLWPVRVRHEVGARTNVQISFDSEREEIRLNPALETIVGQETVKKWAKLADELLGRSALRAADVVDAFGTLATPRSRELAPLPNPKTEISVNSMHLECAGVLFHMTFMGQAIGEDIRNLRSLPPSGTGLETALRLRSAEAPATPAAPRPKELERFFTVFSDPSQESAVLQARDAPGLLVEGPPGTGKSQTIVNMVGDAIGRGKSVLIVCQKHAALEVVHKRLVAEGLNERVVMVNDVNKDRQPIVRAVREQLDTVLRRPTDAAAQIQRKRAVVAARIESNEATLDKHHTALHQVDAAVGLSYRVLLGELIEIEQAGTTPEVPALRAMLQRLNIGDLATLEEEVASAVCPWLPAKHEGSALAALQPFAADLATLNDFRDAFDRFATAEGSRHEVLNARTSSFEVDDPKPHRTWLSSYGNEFISLSDEQRAFLAKWLSLFRGSSSAEPVGLRTIDELRKLRDRLSACRSQDHDERLSSVLTRLPTDGLNKLHSLTAEAVEPPSFFGRLNIMRKLRKGKVSTFLKSAGDVATEERMVKLLAAVQLEQTWRPLRIVAGQLHSQLSLPALDADAGPTMLATMTKTLSLLQAVATQAAHLHSAPQANLMDGAAQTGSRDSFLKLFAEFDCAFARHEVRVGSLVALKDLQPWMQSTWLQECQQAIISNEGNGQRVTSIGAAMHSLAAYQLFRGRAAKLSQQATQVFVILRTKEGVLAAVPKAELETTTRRILNREARLAWKQAMEQSTPELSMERQALTQKVSVLEANDKEMRLLNRQLLQVNFDLAAIRPVREWEDITKLTGVRARRLREFVELGAGLGLMKLRPVWLMNPDVASRVLPLKPGLFDTVIYDEASQMPVEFALPTLFRGKVTVVSGDEKQMPPTAFFAGKVESDEGDAFDGETPDMDAPAEEKDAFEETWNRREIKDCPDLLQLARTNLPNARLQIHYRSMFRELIGYSNAAFYANDLSVPVRHPEAIVKAERPIELVRVDGTYTDQTNPAEAQRVVEIIAQLWNVPQGQRPSVGIVTFNRKQADVIEDALEVRAEEDAVFRVAYGQESQRYEDGEDMSVFVKNVENVQGDERDIIVFSSTFGRNAQGSFLRFFGVLGQKGGERRLNVAVTRSRKKVYMVTSMPIAEISDLLNTRRPPATPRDFLQGYMEYARLVSIGEFATAKALLARITSRQEIVRSGSPRDGADDAFYRSVGDFLRSLGYEANASDDADAFGLDYAIEHPETGLFAIGIECDSPRHPLLAHARAREVWRPQVLQRSLPVLHRVSCHGWFHEGEQERVRLLDAVKLALAVRHEP